LSWWILYSLYRVVVAVWVYGGQAFHHACACQCDVVEALNVCVCYVLGLFVLEWGIFISYVVHFQVDVLFFCVLMED